MKSLILILVLLIAGGTVYAADPAIVNILGATEFEVPARNVGVVDIEPRITLIIARNLGAEASDSNSMRAKLLSVSVGTTARPEYGKAFEFGSFKSGNTGEVRELSVKIDLEKIPDPQTYVAKVQIFRDGAPDVIPQVIELRFIRPPAVLSISPLRVERCRYFPFSDLSGISPAQLKLQETTNRAALNNVQIQTKDYLRAADESSVASQVDIPVIDRIEAGRAASADLKFDGDLPNGSARGTLVVRSNQLVQPIEVAIEIITRLSRFWLVVFIAGSVVAGYVFRTSLEQQRPEKLGRILAERQFGQIEDLRDQAIDERLHDNLDKILQVLRQAIDNEPFNASTLEAAVKKASTDVETLLKNAEANRDTLKAKIVELRTRLDSPNGQPDAIATIVLNLIARLETQKRSLNDGAIETVNDELIKIEDEINGHIKTAIDTFATMLHETLNQMGQWQGLEFEEQRKALVNKTAASEIVAIDLPGSRKLARETEILLMTAVQQVAAIANQVVGKLDQLQLNELKPALGTCREHLGSLQNFKDLDIDRAANAATLIGALREALIDSFRSAASLLQVGEPEGLEEGDFARALDSLRKKQSGVQNLASITPLALGLPGISPILAITTMRDMREAAWWDLQLSVPLTLSSGVQALATATVIGKPQGVIDFQWMLGSSISESTRSNTKAFAPTNDGDLIISVQGTSRTTGEVRTASAVVHVQPEHGFVAASRLSRDLAKRERWLTFVSGILIVAAGYLIFQNNWYGTVLDFVAVLLWGFSVDVGTAKVRELAGPLTGRTLPAPKQ